MSLARAERCASSDEKRDVHQHDAAEHIEHPAPRARDARDGQPAQGVQGQHVCTIVQCSDTHVRVLERCADSNAEHRDRKLGVT